MIYEQALNVSFNSGKITKGSTRTIVAQTYICIRILHKENICLLYSQPRKTDVLLLERSNLQVLWKKAKIRIEGEKQQQQHTKQQQKTTATTKEQNYRGSLSPMCSISLYRTIGSICLWLKSCPRSLTNVTDQKLTLVSYGNSVLLQILPLVSWGICGNQRSGPLASEAF